MTWLLVIGALLMVGIATIVYASANIQSGIFVRAQCTTESDSVLLTFDDGPDPEITPKVLDVLKRHNAKAIFFLIGERVDAHPDIVRQIAGAGHRIGNHTYHHSPYANLRGEKHIEQEIDDCSAAIIRACGERTMLFRPPLGVTTHFMRRLVKRKGLKVIGWDVRSLDTRQETRGETQDEVLARICRKLRRGSIVLLHDRICGADVLAERVIEEAERRGLRVS